MRIGLKFLIFGIVIGIALGGMDQTNAQEMPLWVKNLVSWYQEDKISEQDLVIALEFLSKNNILSLDKSEIQNILQKNPSEKYNIMITKGVKHLVPLDKIKSGGPPPDGIPSIDNPQFVKGSQADFISENDLVIGVKINGVTKAYPLFIMTWHEIVNDEFENIPVAVTYCPLCFTNQVFERNINGNPVEFGTSGKLYNSNLVMYDRMTNSYWSQALGLAIKGELTGMELKKIPFDVLRWDDWIALYPDTLVLTKNTGHNRPYSSDPYSDYFKDPRVLFPVENEDDRIGKKEIILGFREGKSYKAFQLDLVEKSKIINDSVGNLDIVIFSTAPYMGRAYDRQLDDMVLEFEFEGDKIVDKQTRSEWDLEGNALSGKLLGEELSRITYDPGFWFEWVAFHPETELYK